MASTIDHTRQISSTSHYPDTKRRRVQVSDATSYDGPMDGLSLIPHTYQSSRIGAPPLMLLPLASSEIDERSELYLKYNAPQTQEDIDRILRKYDIEVYSKDLYLRYVEDTPASEARPTLLIQTTKDSVFNAAKQRKCVAELYEMLRGMKVSGGTSMITVEMIGYKFWAPKEITLVESDNPFHKVWESELQEMFLKLLDTPMALRGKILSVDLVRLGHNLEDRNINPIVVSITTDWSVDPPQYETVERAMRLALSEAGFDEVEIEFERGHLPLGVTEAPQLKMLTSKEASCPFIRPGSSISCGIARNSDQSTSPTFTGTIGVILELHKPGSNKVEATIALTNHHVVRTGLPGFTAPSEAEIRKLVWPPATLNSVCSRLDKYGYWAPPEKLGLGKDVLPVLFRSPSQKVLSFTLEEAKKLLEERSKQKPGPNMNAASKARYDGQLQEITTLVEKLEDPKYPVQQLGSILYSGGLNRKHCEGGRLDVAGVLLEGTVLINSSNDISHKADRWTNLHAPSSDSITEIDDAFGKNWEDKEEDTPNTHTVREVYKIGTVTGCSHGVISPRKCSNVVLVTDESKHSWSYEITAVGEKGLTAAPFSWKGDSGSAVFDQFGRWLGLLYGGQVKLGTDRLLTYVIPAWAIIDDIKSFSKLECRLKS